MTNLERVRMLLADARRDLASTRLACVNWRAYGWAQELDEAIAKIDNSIALLDATRDVRPPKCSVPGCRNPASYACDYPVKRGTCDAKLCKFHRRPQPCDTAPTPTCSTVFCTKPAGHDGEHNEEDRPF